MTPFSPQHTTPWSSFLLVFCKKVCLLSVLSILMIFILRSILGNDLSSTALKSSFSHLYFCPFLHPTILTFSPVFSSSLPLLVEEGVSSPSRDTRTKSSLLRVDTESEDTLIFPTEPLSSMAAAVKLSHTAHEWKTGGGGGR